MTRNEFIKIFNLGIFSFLAGGLNIDNVFAREDKKSKIKNWVWMSFWKDLSKDEYKRMFEKIKQSGIDAIIPNVYRSHDALYNSNHLPVSKPILDELLPLASETELEIHAWMWTMICNNEDIIEKHPDWFAVNRNGDSTIEKPAYVGYYRFMCPNNPGVQEFVSRTVSELASYDELDGVHLDYIRFPDVILAENLQLKYEIVQDKEYPEYDYCYCNYCVNEFKEATGIDILSSDSPDKNDLWREFRYNSITKFVNNYLVPAAKKKEKFISAAVFPNWENVRQQWYKWEVDAVFPMLYHQYYNKDVDWIVSNLQKGKKLLNNNTSIYSGLMVDMFDIEELKKAIMKSINASADGISFFTYHSLEAYSEEISKLLYELKKYK